MKPLFDGFIWQNRPNQQKGVKLEAGGADATQPKDCRED